MLRELLPRILATPALESCPDDLGRFGRLQTLALHIFQDPCAFDQEELGRFLAQPMAIDALRSFSDTVLDAWGRSAPAAIRIPPNAPIRIVDPNSDLTNLEASPLDLCSAATCACLLWTNMHPERWLQIARASHERGGGALDLTAEVRPCPPNTVPSDELESGPSQSGYVSAITRSGMSVMTLRVKLPAGWDASKVARVRTALQPWQKASHPAMLPLLGVTFSNDANGTPGLSLVYAAPQRTKLTTALANGMVKTPADAYRAMRAVAKALRYLHQARPALVHGGVRPDTVLISTSGDTVLTESGIIKIIEDLKTPGERTMPSGAQYCAQPGSTH
ncbi:hypothetical protein BKA62DRAFT_508647 [Auriculariales sp. MPI-PUGE-AT-0066]|nr:hypothetical protein BKA62DRAFT_508647 [Auriculariales sp. MPI-PUGE-AT-0066]